MASIIREAVIGIPAARCWAAVRAFDALHERLARGFVTGLIMTGDRERQVTFFTGAVATELLIGVDEPSMRLAYTVTDGPLKATHYNAAVQVIEVQPGSCRFVWAIDVLPDELGDRVGQLMDAGLTAIKATLEEG
jgi:Polyketide cyclase / dehydrase and lipid transport